MNSHSCDFTLDLDGQVTCAICGAMDDDMKPDALERIDIFETQVDFE
jgi:hypothetical protein